MEKKHTTIPPVLFSVVLALLSVSFSAPLHYQTLFLTSLREPQTEGALSWDTQEYSESTRDLSVMTLHNVDRLTYLPNSTPQTIFAQRLRRDASRAKRIAASKNYSSSVVSGLQFDSGEYFMRIAVGTPPRYFYMVLDTGSDVVWLQCAPCINCYNQTDPIFNPTNSSSFKSVKCGSNLCNSQEYSSELECQKGQKCPYEVWYGDGSFTKGDLVTETLTLRKMEVRKVALGCGHDTEGLFVGAAGLFGLGRGKLSFLGQAGKVFGNVFSYCLGDRFDSSQKSTLMFGMSSVSKKAVFTPLLTNPKLDTFYYVGLEGISVGGSRVLGIKPSHFKLDPSTHHGGVIVDSGTSVSRLTRPAYVALRNAFRTHTSHLKGGSNFSLFDTCYDLSGKTNVMVPTVVLHFHGADMSLPGANYMVPVDTNGTYCFAFAGTMNDFGLSIIGNIQQQGFRVSFDLAKKRVGFAHSPHGCT